MSAFVATVVPGSVIRGDGATGRYARMPESTIRLPSGGTVVRTAMCFGNANATLARRLETGRPIRVEVEWRGRTLHLLGWPPLA